MIDAYHAAVLGQIEWYTIRIEDLKKDIEHFKKSRKELEGRIKQGD